MRGLERGLAPVILAVGLTALFSSLLNGVRPTWTGREFGPTLVVVGGVTCVGIGIGLFLRGDRRDRHLKKMAGGLADDIEAWLEEQLADDPERLDKRQGRPMTSGDRHVRGALLTRVGAQFGESFQPAIAALKEELRREQIRRYINFFPSVVRARQTVRDLRNLADLRGPLPRE